MLVKKLHTEAKLPTKAHTTDAGFDLYSLEEVTVYPIIVVVFYNLVHTILWKLGLIPQPQPIQATAIQTGVAINLPENHVALIMDKSGLGRKLLKVFGGVIDPHYSGDVTVQLANFGILPYTFQKHHKVAQLVVQEFVPVELEEADWDVTGRAKNGFGSSGL